MLRYIWLDAKTTQHKKEEGEFSHVRISSPNHFLCLGFILRFIRSHFCVDRTDFNVVNASVMVTVKISITSKSVFSFFKDDEKSWSHFIENSVWRL